MHKGHTGRGETDVVGGGGHCSRKKNQVRADKIK